MEVQTGVTTTTSGTMTMAGVVNETRETAQRELWESPRHNWSKFYVDTPFTKAVEEKGDLELRGYASTWIKDRDDEVVAPTAFDETIAPYLQKNPIVLWQHHPHWPLGVMKDARPDASGLDVLAHQPRPQDQEPDWKHLAYHSVRSGIVRTFSIGGYFERDMRKNLDGDPEIWITKVHLMEVSVVSIPANPESIFEAAQKSLGNAPLRPTLTQKHIKQMSQILGLETISDPELLLMSEKQRIERYEELAAYYKKCGKHAPEYEAYHELVKDTLSSKGLATVGAAKRVIALFQSVQGFAPVEEKAGRTISQKNEESIKSAIMQIRDGVHTLESMLEEATGAEDDDNGMMEDES